MSVQARPTLYRGIRMRSRLEASFAEWLDSAKLRWEYEPSAFACERGQYLPDFWLPETYVGSTGLRSVYFEVKPPLEKPAVRQTLDRMKIVWASDPAAILALAMSDDDYWFWLAWNTRSAAELNEFGHDPGWIGQEVGDAIWVQCDQCHLPRIESERRLHAPFFFPEPEMQCPRCSSPRFGMVSHWERKPGWTYDMPVVPRT